MSAKQPKPPTMTGEQLDYAIITLGYNQTTFAAFIGVGARTVRKWVSGELKVPLVVIRLVNAMTNRGN